MRCRLTPDRLHLSHCSSAMSWASVFFDVAQPAAASTRATTDRVSNPHSLDFFIMVGLHRLNQVEVLCNSLHEADCQEAVTVGAVLPYWCACSRKCRNSR